jgi:AbiJ N-terminal domain 4
VSTGDDPYAERKKLTFEQAQGLAPLPRQLALGEISQEFRAILWSRLNKIFEEHSERTFHGVGYFRKPWSTILNDLRVYRYHRLDPFPENRRDAIAEVSEVIAQGTWSDVLGWLEFVLKHPACPSQFVQEVDAIMAYCHLAYRVFDRVVICPVGSGPERETIARAFADLHSAEFHGARDHLSKAASELTAGNFAGSIRESINAVESVARTLEPDGKLSKALEKLERSAKIHPAMKAGFDKLYGYTSDEQGIRHAHLNEPSAKPDETDALFMIGACAAFVSYLINKARAAGPLR